MTVSDVSTFIVSVTGLVIALASLVVAFRHEAQIAAVKTSLNGVQSENAALHNLVGEKTGELIGRDFAAQGVTARVPPTTAQVVDSPPAPPVT